MYGKIPNLTRNNLHETLMSENLINGKLEMLGKIFFLGIERTKI